MTTGETEPFPELHAQLVTIKRRSHAFLLAVLDTDLTRETPLLQAQAIAACYLDMHIPRAVNPYVGHAPVRLAEEILAVVPAGAEGAEQRALQLARAVLALDVMASRRASPSA